MLQLLNNINKNAYGRIECVCGKTTAFINEKYEYETVPECIKLIDALYLEGDYVNKLVFEDFYIIYPSLSAKYDLFYCMYEDKVIWDIDFINIVKKVGIENLTIDTQEEDMFIKKGYFMAGKTFFREIFRVNIGMGIVFFDNGNSFLYRFDIKQKKINYDIYKEGLIRTIANCKPENEEYVLFSGGKDSALISLILAKEFNVNVKFVMANFIGVDWDEDYLERVDFYSKFLGGEKIVLQHDYDYDSFEKIDNIVKKMPLCSHATVMFEQLNNYISQNGKRCWTGQNADAMYALSKTGDRFGPLMCRYLISDFYIKNLKDVKGFSILGKGGNLAALLYSWRKNKKYVRPKNINELYWALFENDVPMALIEKEKKINFSELNDQKTVFEVRNMLYEQKLSSYVVGGDARAVMHAGNMNGNAIFPFSTVLMNLIHRNKNMKISEIMVNKKYISDMIIYYIGKNNYKKMYRTDLLNLGNEEKNYLHQILNNTNYGRSLRDYSNYKGNNLQEALSYAWKTKLFSELKK
ncbi:MAG: hypothetical protein IJD58_12650 [Lachnospiraceae bacterium]|nr:hypothetical protein [Lachnospiraceae bacterium]